MYLKQIKAHGFKSFAEKIVIDLDGNITGIVGPNGSGKSNVVDAVRWVLGEQSVKSLRGSDNMTDVIFSGSKSRNLLNVASVTLVFDNSDNYLPINFNEVALKRRVYRDGTNEYFINNEKCRLKDITDILLDSGIAKESFNIISQGKIDDILSNKPQDRRVVFEEAAGVLKYKRRKEEALRKLERTHENMSRVEDIIGELEIQVTPLKEQKEKALEYLNVKEELEGIEVAVLASDIKEINENYREKKNSIEKLNSEILSISTSNTGNEARTSELKLKIDHLNNDINEKQRQLLEITTKVEKINSRKNIILERQKYQVADSKLHTSLVDAKEKILKIETDLASTNNLVIIKSDEVNDFKEKCRLKEKEVADLKELRLKLDSAIGENYRKQNIIKSKIEVLKDSIENNTILPSSTKAVLDNPRLTGVHNIIGKLFELDETYSTAISTSLGVASSNIVVDNEMVAKEAINYLKNSNLGRATFFPLNIIKPKGIDNETMDVLKSTSGFIAIASNLVSYDKKYYNIILNQLGNVIVVKDIDVANLISKKINYRYRVVTLDGNMLHVGGSITGGNKINNRNVITLKYELESLIKDYKQVLDDISKIEDNMNITDANIASESDKLYLLNKNRTILEDEINSKKMSISQLNDMLDDLKHEAVSINNMLGGSLTNEEDMVIKEYYTALKDKEMLSNNLESILNERDSHKEELDEYEHNIKQENSTYNNKVKELSNLEIEVNRMDVKLDNMLNILSETYNMTYEKAISSYSLSMEVDDARNRVNVLRKKLRDLGMVNLAAIDEYEKVSERYEFLIKQREDLTNAKVTLLEIIEEMDNVMKDDFIKTFDIIKENFTSTFKELFNGGTAELKLTDPNNILETGVEIIASPPGKKLTSISLLSGGEKTFTAISLLFAILKSRNVPFCILDEVEAALDDVNVGSFGRYLTNLATKTQFIVITHKKKTMEFVNTLYGITMQESGVSKLVSVKLEEIK